MQSSSGADYAPRAGVKVRRLFYQRNVQGSINQMNVRHPYRSSLQVAALMLLTTLLAGCGINTIPTLDEQAKAAWGQVQNQYQRRADLIPNLVETVKGYAKHEEET